MSASDLRVEARAELARRELARRHFSRYAPFVYRGYPEAPHLAKLAWYLQQVERYVATGGAEGIGRLMVNLPPRYWKSTTTSVIFPTYVLGRTPDARIIITSYNGSLANGFSRRARNMINDDPFRRVFGDMSAKDPDDRVSIADDSRSVESWDIKGRKGGLAAAGVGGGITGKGANLFIIDDPHKDRADAESRASRERVWDWYLSTAYTRLERNGAMLVIQTRWHADDLSGRLLKAMVTDSDADQWVVLLMPAVAVDYDVDHPEKQLASLKKGVWIGPDPLGRAPGEPLWEEQHTSRGLSIVRVNVGGYEFASLFQQTPQQREGALIKAHKIKRVRADQVPANLDEVRYWDLAVSGKRRADWLAGARCGYTSDGKLYIRHIANFPGPWTDARKDITKQMLRDPASVRQGIEISGQQGGYYQEMKADPKLRLRTIEPVNPREIGNKEVRAQVWGSRIQDDLVYLVDDGTWDVEAFIDQCIAFPNGTRDDEVDGVSGSVQMLGGWSGSLSDVPQDESDVSPWSFAGGSEATFGEIEAWL